MTTSIHQKASQIILGTVVGVIVFTFVVSGIDNMKGWSLSGNQVASVDGNPIEYKDYQRSLNQQVQYFSQMMGGKELSQKELEQFGIKQRVLQGLVQQKLLQNLGNSLGVEPSPEELANEIKKLPYFLTNKKFDVEKYKMLLLQNGFTPQTFEQTFHQDLTTKMVEEGLAQANVSRGFGQAVSQFKNQKVTATVLKIPKSSLQKKIVVTDQQVEAFIKDANNQTKIDSRFARRKAELDRPEQVEARHILFKVDDETKSADVEKRANELRAQLTPSNFKAMADKHTEDPSGKGQGGNLGKFARGRMVPEFENAVFAMKPGTIEGPVKTSFGYHIIYLENKFDAVDAKVADYKSMMAREILQEENADGLKQLTDKIRSEAERLLASGQQAKIEEFQKANEGQLQFEQPLNLWDGRVASVKLEDDQLDKIFSEGHKSYFFENAATLTFVVTRPATDKTGDKTEDPTQMVEREKQSLQYQLSRQLREKAIQRLTETSKIYQNPDIL